MKTESLFLFIDYEIKCEILFTKGLSYEGYIIQFDDNFILIKCLDNSLIVRRIDDIFSINIKDKDKYNEKLEAYKEREIRNFYSSSKNEEGENYINNKEIVYE